MRVSQKNQSYLSSITSARMSPKCKPYKICMLAMSRHRLEREGRSITAIHLRLSTWLQSVAMTIHVSRTLWCAVWEETQDFSSTFIVSSDALHTESEEYTGEGCAWTQSAMCCLAYFTAVWTWTFAFPESPRTVRMNHKPHITTNVEISMGNHALPCSWRRIDIPRILILNVVVMSLFGNGKWVSIYWGRELRYAVKSVPHCHDIEAKRCWIENNCTALVPPSKKAMIVLKDKESIRLHKPLACPNIEKRSWLIRSWPSSAASGGWTACCITDSRCSTIPL